MATYTFSPNTSSQNYDWNSPATWAGGVVPNAPDADVIIPTITVPSTGSPYVSYLYISAGQSDVARSVSVSNNNLAVSGSLSVAGQLSLLTGARFYINGGSVTLGALSDAGANIIATGSLLGTAPIVNAGSITGYYGSSQGASLVGLEISATGFANTGTITDGVTIDTLHGSFTNDGILRGGVTVTAPNGGFTNYANGILTGGQYISTPYNRYAPGDFTSIYLNVGGAIVTDAAQITVTNGGTLASYDSTSGTYIPIQQTLRTIAPTGALTIDSTGYTTSTLDVQGKLLLTQAGAGITATTLTVESGGEVSGIGTISGAVVNNGLIYVPSQPLYLSPTANPLVIAGNVTGSGTMQLGPAQTKTFNNVTTTYGAILELQGAASNTVTYSDNLGMLELGQPSTFTGTIAPGPYSDAVDLAGVSLSSIASYSYAGNSSSGVLTLDRTDGTALTLRYAGDYTTADFKLSAGPQALSNSPPSLLVRNASVQTGNAFYVDGSQGVQRFIGTGFPNFIDTSGAAGSGDVAVDLVAGTVTKGGQLDATFTNIQGVQLGADTSAILGLASGTDLLYGGSGTDTFNGNGATDYIQGGTGTNLIFGSTGNEIFYSNGGADVMRGGSAANFMSGGSTPSSTDVFYGTTGNDYVYGHGGTVDLVGGNGNEFLSGGSGSNELDDRQQQGQVGLSELVGSTGTDLFYGGVGTNLMYGGSGTDTFVGSSGTDFVYGGAGRSFTYSGSGTDVVTTGAGNDYVQAGSGSLYFNDTAANLHAGRFDQLDGFSGSRSTDLYLPTAVQGSTSFVSQNGGTAITTAIGGGIAEVFVSNSAVAQVQAHTHFTL